MRETLKNMIQAKGLLKGEFTLASGASSNTFFDMKPVMLNPQGSFMIARQIIDRMSLDSVGVGGLELGAVPLVSSVVVSSYKAYGGVLGFRGCIVRKIQKGRGTNKLIEGDILYGDRVTVLEDVTTSGGSIAQAVAALRDFGCIVEEAITVVDRLAGGKEFLDNVGVKLKHIFTANDFR